LKTGGIEMGIFLAFKEIAGKTFFNRNGHCLPVRMQAGAGDTGDDRRRRPR
jgi:hypothetical protein